MISLLLLLVLVPRLVSTQTTDSQCLTEFRQSVNDAQQYLKSWSGSGKPDCSSTGVQCLHISELKVYGLSLPSAGLGGDFPKGLGKCSSLTGLDLSGNSFTGPIPATLCSMLPYLVRLDLSDNRITGPIPDLSGCQYLNMLHLQDNLLEASLPAQIGLLPRLQDLNVAGNKLAGPIPSTFGSRFPKAAFQNNAGLCGPPVSHSCSSKASIGLIVGTVVGGAALIAAITGIVATIVMRRRHPQKMKDDATWATKIKAPRSIMVTMFEKPVVGIKFSDLLAATDRFSKDNLITEDSTGVSYKATLRDGSILAVKRLRASNKSEQQFRSEIEALGKVWHVNLVPLLGYCIAGSERLLIYKHMVNGSLWNWLYESSTLERLDWYARLRIALGTARGLGFLHHTCSPKIVHRNISPHTILLDDDLEPRVTGYGLSRLVSSSGFVNQDVLNESSDSGHTPPEYARVPVATTKGDVYSYGVVLLELLTSQKPVDLTFGEFKGNLVEWLLMYQACGRSSAVLDKSLSTGREVDEELNQVLQLACDCVRVAPNDRPSMYEVFGQLKQLALKHNLTFPEDDIPVVVENPPQQ